MIGTAPRKPTQETNKRLFNENFRNGNRERNTENGREHTIINNPIKIPRPESGNNSEGLTNKPKERN